MFLVVGRETETANEKFLGSLGKSGVHYLTHFN